MDYMLLIYSPEKEKARLNEDEMKHIGAAHWKAMDEAREKGVLRGASPLFPTTTSKSVRMKENQIVISDGPFAETKEQLAGFYLIDCRDEAEALEWARKLPVSYGNYSGCIEVRRVAPLPPR